jgi:hypothetical protein
MRNPSVVASYWLAAFVKNFSLCLRLVIFLAAYGLILDVKATIFIIIIGMLLLSLWKSTSASNLGVSFILLNNFN